MCGVIIRTVIVPLLGLGIAYLFFRDTFNGAHFATFVAVFATPVAVSSVPMVQEMGSDVALAGQLESATAKLQALDAIVASLFEEGNPVGIKTALHLKGVCSNAMRLPLVAGSEALQAKMKKLLDEYEK